MTTIHIGLIARRLAAVALSLGTAAVMAAPITTNFSNYLNLAYGSGTTQTIVQDGIRLQAVQGKYEVTSFPEVNLKDFGGAGETRIIELDLASGADFDFDGFSIRDLRTNSLTVTSSRGGNFIGSAFSAPTFSGAEWQDLDWVRFTVTGQYTEAKFTSFTLDDAPTVNDPNRLPEPASLALVGLALAGVGLVRRRHQR